MKEHIPWRVRLRDLPFAPQRLPVFYGFIIVIVGSLGIIASIPGQTIGVSVFTDYLIRDLSISRSALSAAYLTGTSLSALLVAYCGRLYDIFGARILGTLSTSFLSLTLLALSYLPQIPINPIFGITLCFFFLRFSGQGMLTLASRNMVMEWFDRRRGAANMVMGISISVGFSIMPKIYDTIIQHSNWQITWRIIAIATFLYSIIAAILYRDKPEHHKMSPDGPLPPPRRQLFSVKQYGNDFTLAQARKTSMFWYLATLLALSGLLITAFTFHLVSIFESSGLTRQRAISIFLPTAMLGGIFQIFTSYLSDVIKLKYIAMTHALGIFLLSLSIILLKTSPWAYITIILGVSIMNGMFSVLSSIAWPRIFGRKHLGAITGLTNSIQVFGTAIGPLLFSKVREYSGSYNSAMIPIIILSVIFMAINPLIKTPKSPDNS